MARKQVVVEIGTVVGDGHTHGSVVGIERLASGYPLSYLIREQKRPDGTRFWRDGMMRLSPAMLRSSPWRVLDPVRGYVDRLDEAPEPVIK